MTTAPDQDGMGLLERAIAVAVAWRAQGRHESEEELLARHPQLRDLLAPMLREERPGDSQPAAPAPAAAQKIGPYRLLGVLGEGGMGTVYVAEQQAPVRRRVALKVIKLGMDSKAVLKRFDLERQALAVMNHDAIAKVFDAGTTERGQPYFAMELVEGKPITKYCDEHRLSLAERLVLFQAVCAGVQHAHQKGVLHRDLKPGNVLVASKGEAHVPKVIDFGVARATDHQMTQDTVFTEQGQVLGTPEYMSPEQAMGDVLQIDTRSDVYSLGVMLYELLTGELPFAWPELRRAGLVEIRRTLREEEPPKPSTRVTRGGGERVTDLAKLRRTSAEVLGRELRCDLDWIVLKAMAKEPERRYGSAAELGADLGRFLRQEPVLAGPPTVRYRLGKYLRRYRLQAVAAGLVLVALVAGVTGTTWGLLRARANERLANERADEITARKREVEEHQARFDRLAVAVRLERAREAAKVLHPPWPPQAEAMRGWLADARGIEQAIPDVRATLRELRARTPPFAEEEREASRRAHPRYGELQAARARLDSLRRVLAAPPFVPDATVGAMSVAELLKRAWLLVDPEREERGREAEGLALARAAVAKNTVQRRRAPALRTLAWALVANGCYGEAQERIKEAVASSTGDATIEAEGRRLEAAIQDQGSVAKLALQVEDLEGVLVGWQWVSDGDRFLGETLARVLTDQAAFASGEVRDVEQRIEWAERIDALTRRHPKARVTWEAARDAIRKSDRHAGQPIDDLKPQTGLVPIGANPVTGLWEFYELRSAWGGAGDPAAIEIPIHRPDGSIDMSDGTGIVLVLLPGATFRMGAQRQPSQPDHDPQAQDVEGSVHAVTLAPFFLARHELTKGQWKRLSGAADPSAHQAGRPSIGNPEPIGDTHPVEQIDWVASERVLRQHGLALPTEAQWEYACRGGTTTPRWCGASAESLQGCENVLDLSAGSKEAGFSDGRLGLGPVGSYRANPFGLFDMHGNVVEWCLDDFRSYRDPVRAGDGLRQRGDETANPALVRAVLAIRRGGAPGRGDTGQRVMRGGSFQSHCSLVRSSWRGPAPPSQLAFNLGARAARVLER